MDMVDKGRQYSRLNTFDVVNIRKMWDAGMSQGKIMEKFNVTNSQISNMVARRTWKHI